MSDLSAVMWKEWRELRAQADLSPRTLILMLVPLLAIVIAMSAIAGPFLIRSPLAAFVCVFGPIMGMAGTVCEAFAGERERHTLETLLATRLTSEAILMGKILVQVLYGWGIAITLFTLFVLGVNVRTPGVLPALPGVIVIFVLLPLVLFLVAAAGVLVSLRAPTVRQAQSRLIMSVMTVFVLSAVAINLIPKPAIRRAREASPAMMFTAFVVWIAVLGAIDLLLLLAAWARFQRHKLIEIR